MSADNVYSVWGAFGEVLIATGREPVWEDAGKPATLIAEIEAESYEQACEAWTEARAAGGQCGGASGV